MHDHRYSMKVNDTAEASETQPAVQSTPADETSPHLDLSKPASADLRPPVKPFRARPFFKAHQFTQSLVQGKPQEKSRGISMSERFSSDRMAAFSPQIQRRVADIPNPAALRAAEADADGKRLLVSKHIRIKGEIAGCSRLVVEGQVDATLSEVKSLDVVAGGSFKGSADVESAVIAGTYDGTLTVRGHLEIAATGTIKGAVSYKTIMVANGGRVEGTITLADAT